MNKPIIAVDIDDVLAAEAEFIIAYSNEHWGHSFTLDDYTEHWAFWGADHAEFERRAAELHRPGIASKYRILPGSKEVLSNLKQDFELIVVTSRRKRVEQETEEWLDTHFNGIFSRLVLTGFWDNPDRKDRHLLAKGSLLNDHSVAYVIDDQPKHCFSAVEHGVHAIMFGDYAESRDVEIIDGVTRCKDWQAVAEYFGV